MKSILSRARSLALLVLFPVLACTAEVRAQLTAVPATGCADGVAIGTEILSVDNAPPQIDSPTFALEHLCEIGATGAFFLMGNCNPPGPAPDWPLAAPCFGSWASPPATCGFAIDPSLLLLIGGDDVRTGKVLLSLPIPNSAGLIGLETCFQFLCVDLTSMFPCTNVSAGLAVVFQP